VYIHVSVTLQVAGAASKGEFVCGLVRGLGGNLSLADRAAFAKEVRSFIAWYGAPSLTLYRGAGSLSHVWPSFNAASIC
jgi:hypothetical protein